MTLLASIHDLELMPIASKTEITYWKEVQFPLDASNAATSEKAQLRSHCYATALYEQTPALSDNALPLPDSPEMTPVAGAYQNKTSPSSIQEVLSFLFGE